MDSIAPTADPLQLLQPQESQQEQQPQHLKLKCPGYQEMDSGEKLQEQQQQEGLLQHYQHSTWTQHHIDPQHLHQQAPVQQDIHSEVDLSINTTMANDENSIEPETLVMSAEQRESHDLLDCNGNTTIHQPNQLGLRRKLPRPLSQGK
ncbi:hypothetical protein BSLG_003472 [Batrachochytrium salamandrivorans]|nr:hypothetical protein BSLG_010127 [Batrachochytrium salamandrivorans]KAJ1341972.1 hypothetical protein BSLG_003472 [Batrachochytrium salamandrivorans]